MQYGESTVLPISFPWEYDRAGVLIKCYGTGDDLHYVLDLLSWSRVALIQSPAVLEQENIEWVETRYVMDDSIKTEIEQLELDGDVVILGSDD